MERTDFNHDLFTDTCYISLDANNLPVLYTSVYYSDMHVTFRDMHVMLYRHVDIMWQQLMLLPGSSIKVPPTRPFGAPPYYPHNNLISRLIVDAACCVRLPSGVRERESRGMASACCACLCEVKWRVGLQSRLLVEPDSCKRWYLVVFIM